MSASLRSARGFLLIAAVAAGLAAVAVTTLHAQDAQQSCPVLDLGAGASADASTAAGHADVPADESTSDTTAGETADSTTADDASDGSDVNTDGSVDVHLGSDTANADASARFHVAMAMPSDGMPVLPPPGGALPIPPTGLPVDGGLPALPSDGLPALPAPPSDGLPALPSDGLPALPTPPSDGLPALLPPSDELAIPPPPVGGSVEGSINGNGTGTIEVP